MSLSRPEQFYQGTLTAPLTAGGSETEVFLTPLPTESAGSVIVSPRSSGLREKINYTGKDAGAGKLTGCTRGVAFSTATGTATSTARVAGNCKKHGTGEIVEICDGDYEAKVIDVVNGTSPFPNNIDLGSKKITNLADPVNNQDAATKAFVAATSYAGTVNATEAVKGIGEIPTTAEINSDTELGTTGASLIVNPKNLALSKYGLQLPSSDEKAALAGTLGDPGTGNEYVTDADTAGTPLTGAITAYADATGGKVRVTSASHGLRNGQTVVISGSTNYNGTFVVANCLTDTFEITDTWVADDAAGTFLQSLGDMVIRAKATGKLDESVCQMTDAQATDLTDGGNSFAHEHEFTLAASDTLIQSANTERTYNTTPYTLKKSIRVNAGNGGVIRVKFDLKANTTTGYGRIYVDGSAVGTERTEGSTPDTYTTYSEDITLTPGNHNVQLYLQATGGAIATARNFRVYFTKTASSLTSVVTD